MKHDLPLPGTFCRRRRDGVHFRVKFLQAANGDGVYSQIVLCKCGAKPRILRVPVGAFEFTFDRATEADANAWTAGIQQASTFDQKTLSLASMRPQDLCKQARDLPPATRAAVTIAQQYGGFAGGHHKEWVIDQMVRHLLGEERYAAFVAERNEDTELTPWPEGIAP